MSPRPGLAGLAVVLALAAAGCGSAKPAPAAPRAVSPTAYVTSLCDAVGPFEREVSAKSGALTAAGSATPQAAKTKLVAYLGALAGDAAHAVDRLASAGRPTVKGGAAFATAILTTFRRLHTALAHSATAAHNLSTADRAQFISGADTLATAVRESVGDLDAGLTTTANKALNQAAAKVAACHQL